MRERLLTLALAMGLAGCPGDLTPFGDVANQTLDDTSVSLVLSAAQGSICAAPDRRRRN